MIPTNAHKYIKISLYTKWTPTCFSQPCGHLQEYKIQRWNTLYTTYYTLNVSNIFLLYPWRWPHGLLKHVGFHSEYKLILIYFWEYVVDIIVYIQIMHGSWITQSQELLTQWNSIISQKTWVFNNTAVRMSNLVTTYFIVGSKLHSIRSTNGYWALGLSS